MKTKLGSFVNYSKENPLGRRVLAAILLCSTVLAFLATGAQLMFDYQHDVTAIENRMREIEEAYLGSVAASLWSMDDQQTRKQLEGISKLPDVRLVELKDPAGKPVIRLGTPVNDETGSVITRRMPINYVVDGAAGQRADLGSLTVMADLEEVYANLKDKALVILLAQLTKTTIVVVFTLFIFNRLVSRHLSTLAAYARRLDLKNPGDPLALSRKPPTTPDELDIVVSAVNEMVTSLKNDFHELDTYRTGLEKLVNVRTDELAQKVVELEQVIHKLNNEIRERELAERTVRENEERYRQLVEMSPDAIMIEREGRIVFANGGTLKLLGAVDAEQMLGRSLIEFVPSSWREPARDYLDDTSASPLERRPFEGQLVRFDQTRVDVEISRSMFQYAGMPAVQTVVHDITKHKDYEERLRRQALHDALTGLPNRALLMDRLAQAIAHAERHERSVYVLFLDLDRFKYINDSLGHEAGDDLLKVVGARLTDCMRASDTVARLGGDEFVILLQNVGDDDFATRLIRRVIDRVCEPVTLEGQDVSVTCSIGVSVFPKDGNDTLSLLKRADIAMYRAKEQGRNGAQYYRAEMSAAASEHLILEASLRHALERDEFVLHYQPLVSLRTGKIVGAEALVRWRHPQLGLMPPGRFIPLAEQTGLIVGIGEWVMRAACVQARQWHDAGFQLRISVNLSAQQLARPGFESDVAHALHKARLDAQALEIEITESMSMNDSENTIAFLSKIDSMGVGIAVDDFGTGYSNLAYLKRFPINRLKLDRSFLKDPADSQLAQAIIGLAHSLNLVVLAEGVENADQLKQLVEYGCDEIQGYFFSPPVPEQQFMALLQDCKCLELPDFEPLATGHRTSSSKMALLN